MSDEVPRNRIRQNREKVERTINISFSLPSRNITTAFIIIVVATVLATGMFFLGRQGTAKRQTEASASKQSSARLVSIPTYYPQNLPSGYTYKNDARALKPDVLYFSVADSDNHVFFVTQQPIPANFDFKAFDKKFLSPDTFNAEAGTVTAGPAGPTLIGSIRTNQNTWIIVNCTDTKALPQLETIIRSLKLAQ